MYITYAVLYVLGFYLKVNQKNIGCTLLKEVHVEIKTVPRVI